ncbi:hypothetical protein [Saccharothrix variisporea]|uniref:Uncharacterized protein n=1 Tax=Saccharothrix variisporea TaxID=543527 RepID=A0A495XAC9_9PSEU|nr:hypothetical protein [Saccharothrix variisporea]RKT71441.1 hypothetical protein DFJ66_4730 [Saccharothrix variisporea]
MTDTEDELRRLLAARADRVHSHLTGPAIRARATARPRTLRRLAPLVSAVAVVLAVVTASLLLARGPGGPGEDRPATTVPAGGDPRPTVTTTTPDRPTTSPPLTTEWSTTRPNLTTTWPTITTTR